jgi:hypothetical protein
LTKSGSAANDSSCYVSTTGQFRNKFPFFRFLFFSRLFGSSYLKYLRLHAGVALCRQFQQVDQRRKARRIGLPAAAHHAAIARIHSLFRSIRKQKKIPAAKTKTTQAINFESRLCVCIVNFFS